MAYGADPCQKHIAFRFISIVDVTLPIRKSGMLSIRQTKMQTIFMQISSALASIFNRSLSPFIPFTADVECDANIQNISHSVVSLRQLRSTKKFTESNAGFIFSFTLGAEAFIFYKTHFAAGYF
ncbi:hypothetical protein CEXT_403431 [Caerostris extrusa]|uniref:Uncharacterized protein n=1 Tax=Caerostris extrusa TaxID=172846 RepID=A0AAV4V2R4_CAEEX|nr:hypothetical protein CEXT_403431 [Caerostris extrusa]